MATLQVNYANGDVEVYTLDDKMVSLRVRRRDGHDALEFAAKNQPTNTMVVGGCAVDGARDTLDAMAMLGVAKATIDGQFVYPLTLDYQDTPG